MFQSPLKTVTEKLKPTQSKSSISSLKFERPSDFKKFIGFIKNETKELEKIKLPTRAEVEPKSKSGGFGGLLALGLFGGLGAAFGGSGDDDSNLRLGSAGGTTNQFSGGTLLTKNIKRTKNISTTRTTVRSGRVISKKLANERAQFKDKLREEYNRKMRKFNKLKKVENKLEEIKTGRKIVKKLNTSNIFTDPKYSDFDNFKNLKNLSKRSSADAKLITQFLLDMPEVPPDQYGLYDPADYIKAEKQFKLAENEFIKTKNIFEKDLKKGKINLFNGLLDIDLMAENPNLKIKGFSPKDFIDKQIFTRVGGMTKGLRGNLKNLAKTKIGGVSPVGFAKGLGKLAPVVDFGITLPLAINELGLVDFSDGILKPKVGRDNIFTSVYDMFTSFYNAGVDIVGAGESNKRLFITKSRDKKIRAYDDAYNKKILEARRLKQMFNFDQSFGTNFSPDMQLPKSNVFASQKTDGAEFVIPFDYSNSGIYDFNFPIYQKLFKQ